jgi:hypothetical protein
MFSRKNSDADRRRFWAWFNAEAQGLSNALEALVRGESDAEWALDRLNQRIRRFDATLEADLVMSLDGVCHMTVSGQDRAIHALLDDAPSVRGWRFSTGQAELTDRRRIPFRLAPRPSLDLLAQPLAGHHEAYA